MSVLNLLEIPDPAILEPSRTSEVALVPLLKVFLLEHLPTILALYRHIAMAAISGSHVQIAELSSRVDVLA